MTTQRLDRKYPAAANFFAGYLHQDWPEESGSWQAAADLFLAKASPAHAAAAAADVARLLADCATDAELTRALDAFGNAYDPTPDGTSVRRWLELVMSR